MREVIGVIGVYVLFLACGIALLRAAGLLPATKGPTLLFMLGPALLAGTALVILLLIVLLLVGVRLSVVTVALTALAPIGFCEWVTRRRGVSTPRRDRADPVTVGAGQASLAARRDRVLAAIGVTGAGAYLAFGAYSLARLATVGDDARIWSLRGLTIAYYHRLQPEIFLNPFQSGAHPVYPLFQPVLEAVLSIAAGRPELGLYHTELWLLFAAVVWTAALMIRRASGRSHPVYSYAVLAALATSSAAIHNLVLGDADITGAAILAVGGLGLGLWIDRDEGGYLAAGTLLLATAASTKDEDLLASLIVLVAAGVTCCAVAGRRGLSRPLQLKRWAVAAAVFGLLAGPWRVWVAAHHLSDSVTPPLPRALNPLYALGRTHQLQATLTAMTHQTLIQWGWLAALFAALCGVCLITKTARTMTCFYLAVVGAVIASLVWLYTTTPLSLGFLLPTSMDRTVDVFMVLATLASAHLLTSLARASARDRQDRSG